MSRHSRKDWCLHQVNSSMKIKEIINVPAKKQTAKPQSPGSRGLYLMKNRPVKRYFDKPSYNLKKQ